MDIMLFFSIPYLQSTKTKHESQYISKKFKNKHKKPDYGCPCCYESSSFNEMRSNHLRTKRKKRYKILKNIKYLKQDYFQDTPKLGYNKKKYILRELGAVGQLFQQVKFTPLVNPNNCRVRCKVVSTYTSSFETHYVASGYILHQ